VPWFIAINPSFLYLSLSACRESRRRRRSTLVHNNYHPAFFLFFFSRTGLNGGTFTVCRFHSRALGTLGMRGGDLGADLLGKRRASYDNIQPFCSTWTRGESQPPG
jgi:hypothetical protein